MQQAPAASKAHGARSPSAPASPRPLTVCQFIGRWSRGGMELQLAAQASQLARLGIRSLVASSREPETLTPSAPELPVCADHQATTHHATVRSATLRDWLTSLLRDRQADLLHVRGVWLVADALDAARRADVPIIFSFHGFDDASRAAPWWRRWRWRRAATRCDAIVTVSRATRRELAARIGLPAGRIHVIYNGVDTRQFAPPADRDAARTRLGWSDDRLAILCVGSLMPVKGQDLLIEALARLPNAAERSRLIFVGADYMNGALKRLATARLPGVPVDFVGNAADVCPWYRAADLFVAPSRSEGLSNAILEAQACGLPVIATAVGGTPEIVQHEKTGILIPAADVGRLSRAMLDLMNNPRLRERLATAARREVTTRFTLDSAAEAYHRLYRSLISQGPPCGPRASDRQGGP